jgi:hypothetical protein
MNPTHRTRRLSVTLAALAAAALGLPACQGTATVARSVAWRSSWTCTADSSA